MENSPEEEEVIGLDLTFKEAAILKITLSQALLKNQVPFERVPIIIKIANEAKRIAFELKPTQKPKLYVPDHLKNDPPAQN